MNSSQWCYRGFLNTPTGSQWEATRSWSPLGLSHVCILRCLPRQDFITKEYQVSVKEVLDNALQGREAANFEFPLYTKDRQRVEVLLNATTRRDVCGAVVGMIGVGQDITERKQVEVGQVIY